MDLTSFSQRISQYVKRVESIEQSISTLIANAPADYRDYLVKMFRSLTEKLSAIPAYFSEKLPKILSAVAEEAPKLFLFILTYIIATFSIGADRNRLKNVLYTMTPQKLRPYIRSIKKELHDAVSGFFKSQLLLIMITFFELCICFYFIRIHHPPLISAVIAVLDALPLLGTGTVLLPWAIFSLIGGEKMMCIYLLVIYLLTALSRRLLEPRVVSSTLGLDPLLSLLSIYGGFVLFGVAGMMLLPLFVLLFVRLYSANKNAST